MTTEFRFVDETTPIGELADAVSGYVSGDAVAWEPVAPGMAVKRLFERTGAPERTLLFRLDAGASGPPHAHKELEQIYVIEGAFHDGERMLRAGDLCVRSPGAMHSSASDEGAVVLVVFSQP